MVARFEAESSGTDGVGRQDVDSAAAISSPRALASPFTDIGSLLALAWIPGSDSAKWLARLPAATARARRATAVRLYACIADGRADGGLSIRSSWSDNRDDDWQGEGCRCSNSHHVASGDSWHARRSR